MDASTSGGANVLWWCVRTRAEWRTPHLRACMHEFHIGTAFKIAHAISRSNKLHGQFRKSTRTLLNTHISPLPTSSTNSTLRIQIPTFSIPPHQYPCLSSPIHNDLPRPHLRRLQLRRHHHCYRPGLLPHRLRPLPLYGLSRLKREPVRAPISTQLSRWIP